MIDIRRIRRKGKMIFAFLMVVGAVFFTRAAQIQILQHRKFAAYADSQHRSAMPLKAKRGSIYDCQGKVIAYDVDVKTYTVSPRYINNKRTAAIRLSRLTGKSSNYWIGEFRKHPGFLVVASRVPRSRESDFENAGIETLRSRPETARIYPYNGLAEEVIGRTDPDNIGVSGLEKYYNGILSGSDGSSVFLRDARGNEVTSWEHTLVAPVDGNDLYLALDIDLEQITTNELSAMLDSSEARWGSAIFLDVETGGVLACATVERERPEYPRCRSIADMNEPGSTAKIMPLVTVFQAGLFEPDDFINVEHGRFSIGRRVIRDDHPYDSLRCTEVGIYSSNIGVSKMGLEAGPDLIYRTLIQFGFGAKTGIDFPGESAGELRKPDKWSDHLLANICFGYGITATGIQLALAYGAIANGGDLLKPFFATRMASPDGSERILNSRREIRRVLDDRTRNIIHGILTDVVLKGTAKKARDEYSLVAGKTGTALRTYRDKRGYDPKRSLASFAGYFPAHAPRIVGIVIFGEPETSIYGGEISAPVFRRIAVRYSRLPRNYEMLGPRLEYAEGFRDDNRGVDEKADILPVSGELAMENHETVFQESTTLPDFRGITVREAMRRAQALGLKYEIEGSGVVKSQNPSPGAPIKNIAMLKLTGG